LSDLTKRENRFAHLSGPANFPHAMDLSAIRVDPPNTVTGKFPTGSTSSLHPFGLPFEWGLTNPVAADPTVPPVIDRQGEDVMLNDVLAFDLRVYDPGAPILEASGITVEPSDFGWNSIPNNLFPTGAAGITPVGFGAYVDLHWNVINSWAGGTPRGWTTTPNDPTSFFGGVPNPKSGLNFSIAPIASVAYDTWPYHYESDGLDQDSAAGDDQGTNGLDDIVAYDLDNDPTTPNVIPTNGGTQIAINGVDDVGERETAPPYDTPLRAMQVKIRVYDRDTRQIREATVTRNFVPQ